MIKGDNFQYFSINSYVVVGIKMKKSDNFPYFSINSYVVDVY